MRATCGPGDPRATVRLTNRKHKKFQQPRGRTVRKVLDSSAKHPGSAQRLLTAHRAAAGLQQAALVFERFRTAMQVR